jgi:peptidoglycan/xylan/chitin deacetylase (PgdA/CDA1 family)
MNKKEKVNTRWGKVILMTAASLLVFFSLLYGLFLISKSRTFQFFGELVNRVQTSQKIIALTFDDAPNQRVNEVLEILKQKDVKATFYEIGGNIEQYPAEAKAIVAAGMEVGNHSYSHQRFLLKPLSFVDTEIQKTNQLIRDSGYTGEITFRPPYGKKLFALPWYLRQHDITTVMCDVEPDTYVPGDSEAIVRYTLERVQSGSIILLHPFCETECAANRAALPLIIDGLKEKGYRFVTISELLKTNDL